MQMENDCTLIGTEFSDWISQNIIEEPFEKVGNPIRKFIPPHFEAYCKIFHPFIIDLDASDAEYNEKEEERKREVALIKKMYDKLNLDDMTLLDLDLETFVEEASKKVVEKHKQEGFMPSTSSLKKIPNGSFEEDMEILLYDPFADFFSEIGNHFETDSNGTKLYSHPLNDRKLDKVKHKLKISWKNVARKYELKFHNNISPTSYWKKFEKIGSPLNLYFPYHGLDIEDCHKILAVLKGFSKTQKIVMNSFLTNYDLGNQLCPIEKMVNDNQDDALNGGLIIDENKEWVIYADYHRDLQMTIIGGSKQLIDALKTQTDLEIVECSEFSRVDHYSDTLN